MFEWTLCKYQRVGVQTSWAIACRQGVIVYSLGRVSVAEEDGSFPYLETLGTGMPRWHIYQKEFAIGYHVNVDGEEDRFFLVAVL